MLDFIATLFSTDVALDLGTANTLVYVRGKGIVANEPSVVALKKEGRNGKKVLAVGLEAKEMLGRTPGNIIAIRPLREGVIADFEAAEEMIRYFLIKAHKRNTFVRPRVVISIPSGITQVEKRAVKESAEAAGAREVYLVEQPLAAAIGAGLPITEPVGNMVVEIGGGTTEVAVISLSGIVVKNSVRVGGDKMDEAIVQYMRKKYNLFIGERTAEEIKIKLGNACPEYDPEETIEVKGRDLISGIPRVCEINSYEVREAINEPLNQIIQALKETLEKTPPQLASDLVDRGIIISGGGSLLRNMDLLIRKSVALPVTRVDEPLFTVVKGVGWLLDDVRLLREVASD